MQKKLLRYVQYVITLFYTRVYNVSWLPPRPCRTNAPARGGSLSEASCLADLNSLPYRVNAVARTLCALLHLLPLLVRHTARAAPLWQSRIVRHALQKGLMAQQVARGLRMIQTGLRLAHHRRAQILRSLARGWRSNAAQSIHAARAA